jgi:hypothetical protein
MKIKTIAACMAALVTYGLPGVACAEESSPPAVTEPAEGFDAPALSASVDQETAPQATAVDIVAVVDALVAEHVTNGVSDTDLIDQRGGQSLVIGNQTLTAITTGSVINGNYNAGTVSLSDNALSNFTGMGNVLINTGAQNNLQSGMNVTINVNN